MDATNRPRCHTSSGNCRSGDANCRRPALWVHLTQRDRCVSLDPLSGEQPVAELYDWDLSNTRYRSAGTVDLQRSATSILFLYDGPGGLSLVMVHGELAGDSPGGSVTFQFDGLPIDGE